jgi:hypothetical protein
VVIFVSQPVFICDTFDEKFQLAGHKGKGNKLSGEQWKALGHIMFKHGPGNGNGVYSGAILLDLSLVEHFFDNI